ncbi:hypothetical protein NQ176_g9076 [Zarea fungicola]|uniref:Uncharacterized protein n=1 Tax=Zarea fungicola TaxID=93591 RepID=A0ACC1MNR0_9HYPO|nr:hypothetical protein NQ176_g9076 [Lecanicillium fungicola]
MLLLSRLSLLLRLRPVIPPVETTAPLGDEVNAAEPAEIVPAATEVKTEVKEKRKSSLPFFGKRDASPSNGEEKAKGGAFSKLRATIKGKGAAKAEEAKEDVKVEESAADTATDAKETTEEVVADAKEEVAKPAEGETENKPEAVAAPAPVVTASA